MEPNLQAVDDRGVGGIAGGRTPTSGREPGVWTSPCHVSACVSHHGEIAWFAKPFSLLPTLEKFVKGVERFYVLTSATLGKSLRRFLVGDRDVKREPLAENDLLVEDAYRVR